MHISYYRIGIRTLAYGHTDIKRIIKAEKTKQETARAAAGAAEACSSKNTDGQQKDVGDVGDGEEEEEEEEETDEQLEQLSDRIYLKALSIPILGARNRPTFESMERLSGGRIKPIDSERFLEVWADDTLSTLDKKNIMKLRIKTLLEYRKKKKKKL